jgi:ATP/maltotriose-dependent transcriptional regulator MalT
MDEAGQVELSPQVITLLNPVPSQRAQLLLAQRDVHAAAQWTTAAGLSPDDEADYPHEPAYLVLARVLLAQNDPGPALTLLQALLDLEVLGLIAAGRSNQRIAHDLVVALDTVKKHVTHVLGKLGAANRTEAAARARQLGLIP